MGYKNGCREEGVTLGNSWLVILSKVNLGNIIKQE